MKEIKVFLASSEEMKYDYLAFSDLIRKLDDIYEKRGIRIKPIAKTDNTDFFAKNKDFIRMREDLKDLNEDERL